MLNSVGVSGWPGQPARRNAVSDRTLLTIPGLHRITPSEDCRVTFKAWAAGGAGGRYGGRGGASAYLSGSVVLLGNVDYWWVVGAGGTRLAGAYTPASYYGGGRAKSSNADYAGGGGGLTGLFVGEITQAKALWVVGAGGGGGITTATYDGGAGGTTSGSAGGTSGGTAAGGGTQSAGGAGATGSSNGGSGSALTGGDGNSGTWGAGGGAGYFGGGGGGLDGSAIKGGGGGSSWWDTVALSNVVALAGSGQTPGNSSDAERGTAGNGGSVDTDGAAGLVVIRGLVTSAILLAA